jgi:CubicO group peptidase (beta-lactamase class C family)
VILVAVAALLSDNCGSQAAEPFEIDSILRKAVERGDVPGVVAMAATSEKIIYQGAFGKRYVGKDEDMTLDSIFRIASMTKPITSAAAMQLVDEGALTLDTPVSKYIPGFTELQVLEGIDEAAQKLRLRAASTPVTLKHLLTHTAGFGYEFWNPLLRDAVAAGLLQSIREGGDGFIKAPLVFDPGARWHYGINTDWLGRLVETIRGSPLDQVFVEHIFRPLEMEDTHFHLPASKEPRFVTVHARQDNGSLKERTRAGPTRVSFCSGGGGLFSTAPDYTRFLRAFLRGGELDGARILKTDTVALMGKNQIGGLEAGSMRTVMPQFSNDFDFFPGSSDRFGLGFLVNSKPVPRGRAAGSLAWAGLFNTYFWLDPTQDLCGVLMTQVLPFYDARVVELLGDFERAVYRRAGTGRVFRGS